MKRNLNRTFIAGALASVVLGVTACGSPTSGTDTTSQASTSSSSTSSAAASATAAADASTESPTLASLVAEVQGEFQQFTYTDPDTGLSLPYNLFIPADYDESTSYPLVSYIADSSLVGQDVTAPLSQYGALIWASEEEQAKHESIVLVPEYPEVIIDDHGSFTTTDYVEMTARLIASVESQYSVDTDRVYGTGQSMGCMTTMLLAAEHPDLFTAELFVSGQWDPTQLAGLADEKFFYIAAGGDDNSTGGQADVQDLLDAAGVSYNAATDWDATWSADELDQAATDLLAKGTDINFATFETGTVLEVDGASSSTSSSSDDSGTGTPPSGMSGPPSGASGGSGGSASGGGSSSEHMASFQPAYEITALRDWLFAQTG